MSLRQRIRTGGDRGFTLLETMLALVVFSIIGVAVYQVMIRTNQSERVSTTVAEAQQNARVALDTILSDLRQAGYGLQLRTAVPFSIIYVITGLMILFIVVINEIVTRYIRGLRKKEVSQT